MSIIYDFDNLHDKFKALTDKPVNITKGDFALSQSIKFPAKKVCQQCFGNKVLFSVAQHRYVPCPVCVP